MTREEAINKWIIPAIKNTWNEKKCEEIIKALEQKVGRWLPIEYDGYADGYPVWGKWECSECGYEHNGDEESLTAFCPDCGRKMEVEK